MNKLTVQRIEQFDQDDLALVSQAMDALESHDISCQPWEEYKTANRAAFTIAYSESNVFLKFYVKEQNFNSSIRDVHGDVHKDNCVEFFVAFEKEYYNLEFNCLGSIKVGYGEGRNGRIMLPVDIVKKIRIHTALTWNFDTAASYLHWEILLVIPKDTFCFSSVKTFNGLKCRANFYKCGDDLPDPHYLTWNGIQLEKPDFHQPAFFGELFFTDQQDTSLNIGKQTSALATELEIQSV